MEVAISYLGMPLFTTPLRFNDFNDPFEKLEGKLAGWKARMLSKGGCLVF
jgi:hypothetical protein